MSIHELLANFDANELKVQFMDECMGKMDLSPKRSKIVVHTDALNPGNVMADVHPVGVLVWIPRDKWGAFQKQQKPGGAS